MSHQPMRNFGSTCAQIRDQVMSLAMEMGSPRVACGNELAQLAEVIDAGVVSGDESMEFREKCN